MSTEVICAKRFNNLRITAMEENEPGFGEPIVASILFTPDMTLTLTHYHIDLTQREVDKLRDWLDENCKARPSR